MKILISLLCTLLATQAFSVTKELFCEMEFGEHTTKFAPDASYERKTNYSVEESSVSHIGYTCTCTWIKADHGSTHLKTTLTLPSGASISGTSDGERFQYVVETQAKVSCRGAVANTN